MLRPQEYFTVTGRRVPPPPRRPPPRFARYPKIPTTRYDPARGNLLFSASEIQRRNAAFLEAYTRERRGGSHAHSTASLRGGGGSGQAADQRDHEDRHTRGSVATSSPRYTTVSDISSREGAGHPPPHHHNNNQNMNKQKKGGDENSSSGEDSAFLHRGEWWSTKATPTRSGGGKPRPRPGQEPSSIVLSPPTHDDQHTDDPVPPPSRPPPPVAGRQTNTPPSHLSKERVEDQRQRQRQREAAEEWRRSRQRTEEPEQTSRWKADPHREEERKRSTGAGRQDPVVPPPPPPPAPATTTTGIDREDRQRLIRESAARRERSAMETENWRRSRSRSGHPAARCGADPSHTVGAEEDLDGGPVYLPGGPGRMGSATAPSIRPPSSRQGHGQGQWQSDRGDYSGVAPSRSSYDGAGRPYRIGLGDGKEEEEEEEYPYDRHRHSVYSYGSPSTSMGRSKHRTNDSWLRAEARGDDEGVGIGRRQPAAAPNDRSAAGGGGLSRSPATAALRNAGNPAAGNANSPTSTSYYGNDKGGGNRDLTPRRRGTATLHDDDRDERRDRSLLSVGGGTFLDRLQDYSVSHFSPSARYAEDPLLEGVELLPPQPALQGMHSSCPCRYRQTLERFTAAQPPHVQPELEKVMQRYEGRESELCGMLARIYGEEFDEFKATPQKSSRHETPMRSGSEPLPEPYPTRSTASRGVSIASGGHTNNNTRFSSYHQ